jgi:hypothetical protein
MIESCGNGGLDKYRWCRAQKTSWNFLHCKKIQSFIGTHIQYLFYES